MYVINIDFSYRENYGAHDWYGEGECPQYWKDKGLVSRAVTVDSLEEVGDIVSVIVLEEEQHNDNFSHVSYYGHSVTEMEELKHKALVWIKTIVERSGSPLLLGSASYGFKAGSAAFDMAIAELEKEGVVITSGPPFMQEILEVKSDVLTWEA